MAPIVGGQTLVLSVLVFTAVALVKLYTVVISIVKKRWQMLELTKGIDRGGLKEPHFIFGDLHQISRKEEDIVDNLIKRSNCCTNMRTLWYGSTCIITALNPEYIKLVVTNADSKESFAHNYLKHWLGEGLLLSSGEKWRRHRRLLNPAFHLEILKPYVKLFVDSTNIFLDKLTARNGTSFDVGPHVDRLTLDTLLKCSFSYESNCQSDEHNPYIESVHEMSELINKRTLFIPYYFDFIYRWSPQGRQFFKHVKRVHDKAEATIRNRRQELARQDQSEREKQKGTDQKRKYLDFLDVLLQAKDEDGNGLEDLEIREEVDTFLFAGIDTSATGISWCFYNLARFPEFQQKCREEVNELLTKKNKEELEWDDLSQLPFLTMFIKESLRFHPPVPFTSRTLSKDVKMPNGLLIPKGTTVTALSIVTHHHHLYWDEPEVFDPYRFLPENNAKRHSHAFIPFSAGPRNCIGQNFAMNEMKIVIAKTIRRFKISPDPEKTPQWIISIVLRSRNGMHLRFEPIDV